MERIGLAPGTELGGYRVLGPLGQGGMGAVYRALDGDGATVALKLVHPHLTDGPARDRLTREVAALQRVRHPGVARVLDAEIDSAEAFVVTELVDGPTLAEHVETAGPLPADALADLAEQLRVALSAVHGAGVVHRDLTPTNVLVSERGPVLIDFGIAQAAEDARVTSAGQVAGTPGYLSPALLAGHEPSTADDWWGWACVLAFAATGRPPFGVRPLAAVLARVRTGEVDLDDVDPRVAEVLRAALAVDAGTRPAPEATVAGLRRAAELDGATVAGTATTAGAPPAAGTAVATAVLGAGASGGTRVLPVDPPAGPADVGTGGVHDAAAAEPDVAGGTDGVDDDEAYDDEGYDDEPDEDDADEADEDEDVDEADLPSPRRRTGTVLAVGAALAAAGAAWPGVALLVAVVLAVVVRSVGLDVDAMHARRLRRGARGGDAARAVAGWPWYLLRAVLGVLPAALVAASAVVVVGGVGWWLVDTGRVTVAPPAPGESAGDLAGNAAWVVPALLAVALAVGLVLVWFGPMSRATRRGARWTLAAVAPGRAGAATAVLVALAAAAVLGTLVVLGQPVTWWPLPGPPDLR